MKFCPKCEISLRKIFEENSITIQSYECKRCGYTKTVNNSHKEKSSIEIARETHPNAYKKWKDEDVKDIEKFWSQYSETKTKKSNATKKSKPAFTILFFALMFLTLLHGRVHTRTIAI